MQIDGDFAISAITPGISVTLTPQHGTPSGLSRVTRIDLFTAAAGSSGWRVGRPLIVRVQ